MTETAREAAKERLAREAAGNYYYYDYYAYYDYYYYYYYYYLLRGVRGAEPPGRIPGVPFAASTASLTCSSSFDCPCSPSPSAFPIVSVLTFRGAPSPGPPTGLPRTPMRQGQQNIFGFFFFEKLDFQIFLSKIQLFE